MRYSERPNYYLWLAGNGEGSSMSYVNKFGRNPDVDTGAYEDIWGGGGTWVAPTTARVHSIVSTSANDTSAGTGARTIRLLGLNSSYALAQEDVTLNGLTPVNTVGSYTMLYRAYILTAGSGGENAGDITATAAVDATVTFKMSAGMNQTLLGVYQIPAGYRGYLLSYYSSINNAATTVSGDVQLRVKPFGGVWQVKHILGMNTAGSSIVHFDYHVPLTLDAKDTIKLAAQVSANNMDVTGGFDLVLEQI